MRSLFLLRPLPTALPTLPPPPGTGTRGRGRRGQAHLGGQEASQVDLWEHLLAVALPVGLLGFRQLVRGQHLGGRDSGQSSGWCPAPSLAVLWEVLSQDPQVRGSIWFHRCFVVQKGCGGFWNPSLLSNPWPFPGPGNTLPRAPGWQEAKSTPSEGGHPQGRRPGTYQMEILLCVQVFHCERENTINKQERGRGEREKDRNGDGKLERGREIQSNT